MATVESDPLAERREELVRLKEERDNLAAEWSDRRFDDITRSRFNDLEGEIREAEEFIKEKEKVQRLVERNVEIGTGLEEGATFQTRRPGVSRGDDIWDLSTVERSWDNPEIEAKQLHDRAQRAIERSKFPHPNAKHEDTQGHLERMLGDGEDGDRDGKKVAEYLLATGSPEYKQAFTRAISGQPLTERQNGILYRAMSLTAASGGYAVPFVLDPTLIPTSNGAVNPYRAISNVSQINVDEWRGVTSGGVTAAFQAEAAEVADASPTLAQPTVSTEMGRAFIPFSIEIGMDWSGFASDMARDIQDGKDVLEATKFAVGSGTNEPFGVITGSSASVYTASNTNSLVIADIYGVHDAMPARWRGRSVWVMNNATLSRIRQLDTAGGSAMLTSTLQARSAANIGNFTDARANVDIFGKPVYEASGQSGTFTTGQLIAVLGDFSYFKIIDRIGLTVETIPHLFATANNLPSGQRGLFAYWRTGSKILSASAFRVLKLA
jgi:HK97 family phage major capsid protein